MIKLIQIFIYVIKSFYEDYLLFDRKLKRSLQKKEKQILKKINDKGYYVWKNFFEEQDCDNIKNEIDKLIDKGEFMKEYNKSDYRIYGGNYLSSSIGFFNRNNTLKNLASAFLNMNTTAFFTLSAKINYTNSNLGSGQGWHRDTYRPYQFKAMLYLCDVNEDNGPFQILEGTNKKFSLFENYLKYNFDFNKNRFSNEEIKKISKHKKIKTFTASKGDLILFNSYCIHRGSPLNKGNRYALTNYYFPENFIQKNYNLLIKKFNLPYEKK